MKAYSPSVPRPSDFLDMMREQLDLPSDYAISKLLNMPTQAVSKYRHNRVTFSDETAAAVADALGIERGYVIACMQAHNAKSNVAHETWLDLALRLAPAAALSLLIFFGFAIISPENVAFAALPFSGVLNTVYYVNSDSGLAGPAPRWWDRLRSPTC